MSALAAVIKVTRPASAGVKKAAAVLEVRYYRPKPL
jgi:hypothetical protein